MYSRKERDPREGTEMKRKTLDRTFGNPFEKGTQEYEEFESDVQWMKKKYGSYEKTKMDEFGNRIIYKTSGFNRLVIFILVVIIFILLGK